MNIPNVTSPSSGPSFSSLLVFYKPWERARREAAFQADLKSHSQ